MGEKPMPLLSDRSIEKLLTACDVLVQVSETLSDVVPVTVTGDGAEGTVVTPVDGALTSEFPCALVAVTR